MVYENIPSIYEPMNPRVSWFISLKGTSIDLNFIDHNGFQISEIPGGENISLYYIKNVITEAEANLMISNPYILVISSHQFHIYNYM